MFTVGWFGLVFFECEQRPIIAETLEYERAFGMALVPLENTICPTHQWKDDINIILNAESASTMKNSELFVPFWICWTLTIHNIIINVYCFAENIFERNHDTGE